MSEPLTLLAVHAHPDDEVTGTGGVLARYGDEGVRTVVVTCTGGELGDGPDGMHPHQPGHDPDAVARLRRAELETSCRVLGVGTLVRLGYRDSGMMGWPENEDPRSFWRAPLAPAVERVGALLEAHRPQVVITYDPQGGYGHPDHIQAHRVAVAAVQAAGRPVRLCYTAWPRSWFARWIREAPRWGIDLSEWFEDGPPTDPPPGTPDEDVGYVVDIGTVVERKRQALLAHGSQSDNGLWLRMPAEAFHTEMGREAFVAVDPATLAVQAPDGEGPQPDLFAGLA
ncbi:MAG TPA: PIG-L family deacetylase [Candidatus Micrarchaeia archaeon]|nr:PIG-L family deacetylase [Candidatus Micrarchaeia archaeon]